MKRRLTFELSGPERVRSNERLAVTTDDGELRTEMIEGLKVSVPAAELRDLCIKQADFHRERAGFYGDKVKALEGVPSNAAQDYSGQDPKQQMHAKLVEHENATRELVFIGDHLKATEEYLLTTTDLQRLGIVRPRVF